MNKGFLSLMLFALLVLSCSNDALNNIGIESTRSLNMNSVDSMRNVTIISSMEDFYAFLAEKVNLNSLQRDYTPKYSIPNASITTVTKVGYTEKFMIFEDCENLEIYFSDFQTADKLGLIAHKTYFITIFTSLGKSKSPIFILIIQIPTFYFKTRRNITFNIISRFKICFKVNCI